MNKNLKTGDIRCRQMIGLRLPTELIKKIEVLKGEKSFNFFLNELLENLIGGKI